MHAERARLAWQTAAAGALAAGLAGACITLAFMVAVFWRPLPVHDERGLVVLRLQVPTVASFPPLLPLALLPRWRADRETFTGLAAWVPTQADLGDDDGVERISGAFVSHDFFDVLGVSAFMGSVHGADLERAADACLLSHGLWQRRLGGRSDALGQRVVLNGRACVVAGVLPAGFSSWRAPEEFWQPLAAARGVLPEAVLHELGYRSAFFVGRPTVAAHAAVARRLSADYALVDPNDAQMGARIDVASLRDESRDARLPHLAWLVGIAGVLVFINGTATASTLLLARAAARQAEFALRGALGAGAGRLWWHAARDAFTPVLSGTAVGLLTAHLGLTFLQAWMQQVEPRLLLKLDLHVVLATILVGWLTGLWLGTDAYRALARGDLASLLKTPGVSSARSGTSARAFVAAQVAAAAFALCLASILIVDSARVDSVPLGMLTDARYALTVRRPQSSDGSRAATRLDYGVAAERLRAVRGVGAVALASEAPLVGRASPVSLLLDSGRRVLNSSAGAPRLRRVSRSYFDLLEIPLVEGALFEADEQRRVAVLSRSAAHALWPDDTAVGRRFKWRRDDESWVEVVGVVADTRSAGPRDLPQAEIYAPFDGTSSQAAFLIRVDRPERVADARQVLRAWNARAPLTSAIGLQHAREALDWPLRYARRSVVGLGAVAFGLAAAGVLAITALLSLARSAEFGLRAALGATMRDLASDVLRWSVPTAAGGAICGTLAALASVSAFKDELLLSTVPTEAWLAALVGLLGTVAMSLVAALPAAVRAAQSDPARLLRDVSA